MKNNKVKNKMRIISLDYYTLFLLLLVCVGNGLFIVADTLAIYPDGLNVFDSLSRLFMLAIDSIAAFFISQKMFSR